MRVIDIVEVVPELETTMLSSERRRGGRNFGSKLSEAEILDRYKRIWPATQSMDQVRRHADLEGELTDDLLASTSETRWQVFSDAYSRLYADLPWLNESGKPVPEAEMKPWARLIGTGKRVIEIGSGKGDLIAYLATLGNECWATEVTRERGEKFVDARAGVKWMQTDGVNLSRFAAEGYYDFVMSDQVYEHLHPDDHLMHLTTARDVLRPGGQYILRTPHRSIGPMDLSRVFGLDEPVFMHLHEANYRTLAREAKQAGFRSVRAVFGNQKVPLFVASRLFLEYQKAIEAVEEMAFRRQDQRRRFRRIMRYAFVQPQVFIVAEK